MSERARLAVSNIAWETADEARVATLLRTLGVTGVEIAPTKWRADPIRTSAADRATYRRVWEDRGLPIVAMQSLLFGQPQLQLFGTDAQRDALESYLRGIIDLGASFGATALVFGSPKNRVRNGRPLSEALDIATPFFSRLGAHAAAQGTMLCVEANPPDYECDFITTTAEAVDLCARVDSPGVRVNGDLGGMTLSREDPAQAIALAGAQLGHFHASEPHLAELGAAANHPRAGTALREVQYDRWVSVEMRVPALPDPIAAIQRAVRLARVAY